MAEFSACANPNCAYIFIEPEIQRLPCPQCGGMSRTWSKTLKVSGKIQTALSGHVKGDRHEAFRHSQGGGQTNTADLHDDGSLTRQASGKSPQGEEDTLQRDRHEPTYNCFRILVDVDRELLAAIDALAGELGESRQDLLRRFIEGGLKLFAGWCDHHTPALS